MGYVPKYLSLFPFYRLDAVQDLLDRPSFETDFTDVAKGLPDLERIVSRIHAKNCKVKDFLKVLQVRRLV
jgi:DNA mismatch repair protein MSH6